MVAVAVLARGCLGVARGQGFAVNALLELEVLLDLGRARRVAAEVAPPAVDLLGQVGVRTSLTSAWQSTQCFSLWTESLSEPGSTNSSRTLPEGRVFQETGFAVTTQAADIFLGRHAQRKKTSRREYYHEDRAEHGGAGPWRSHAASFLGPLPHGVPLGTVLGLEQVFAHLAREPCGVHGKVSAPQGGRPTGAMR